MRGALLLLAAYTCALGALSIDLVFWVETPLLAEGAPAFGDLHPYRTGLIILASALTVLGISPWGLGRAEGTPRRGESRPDPAATRPAGADWPGSAPPFHPGWVHWGILGLGLGSLLLFLLAPRTFLNLQNEDQMVEVASAVFLFAASLVFLRVFWRYRRTGLQKSGLFAWTAFFFSAAFFLIAMEEVSWFQRVLGIETPAVLAISPRDELNLHNLATDLVENAYYGGAFALLVLLPFLHERTGLLRGHPFIRIFMPSGAVLIAASVAMAYNYDMWNILFTQLAFFLTFFILVYKAWESRATRAAWIYVGALAALLLLLQAAFLALGGRFVQGWEVTEYKELLFPVAFLLYSLEVRRRAYSSLQAAQAARAGLLSGLIPSI